jgi:hypothetical protein
MILEEESQVFLIFKNNRLESYIWHVENSKLGTIDFVK